MFEAIKKNIKWYKYLNGLEKDFTREERIELFTELLHKMFPDFDKDKKGRESAIRKQISEESKCDSKTSLRIYEKGGDYIKFEVIWWNDGKILGRSISRTNGFFLCLYQKWDEIQYERLSLDEIYNILGV